MTRSDNSRKGRRSGKRLYDYDPPVEDILKGHVKRAVCEECGHRFYSLLGEKSCFDCCRKTPNPFLANIPQQ